MSCSRAYLIAPTRSLTPLSTAPLIWKLRPLQHRRFLLCTSSTHTALRYDTDTDPLTMALKRKGETVTTSQSAGYSIRKTLQLWSDNALSELLVGPWHASASTVTMSLTSSSRHSATLSTSSQGFWMALKAGRQLLYQEVRRSHRKPTSNSPSESVPFDRQKMGGTVSRRSLCHCVFEYAL